MLKIKNKKTRVVQGTQIPVACNLAHLFNDTTNFERGNGLKIKVKGNVEKSSVYMPTPRSSRNDGAAFQAIQSPIGVLKSPMQRKMVSPFPFPFPNQIVGRINFGRDRTGLVEPAVRVPVVFSGSSQGSNTETVGAVSSDLRLERHRKMFKSRYTKKNRGIDVGGVRLNRRFDLLMKFREDQLDAAREVK